MNRLAQETSPYLRQHADNPVDWYPWGDEAFGEARRRDRPVLLSVGYSACHWCHVMAHESFEDPATALLMNELFVNVKVDREERPDVDAIYMEAVQSMTGHGGWPMTVFLTPDGRPFYGGTYFPPMGRGGMPSFEELCRAIDQHWRNDRSALDDQASQLTGAIGRLGRIQPADGLPPRSALDDAAGALVAQHDTRWGGFGGAPKFPQAMSIELLLRHHARTGDDAARAAALHSLDAMASGGIYDHLGGGFARYSVDERWLVPHFEKMLYDNALLTRAYLHAWQSTGEDRFRQVVSETVHYVLRDLHHPSGAFLSSEDADSEGEEGRFYVWTAGEVRSIGGEACVAWYGVTETGNFEGRNILNRLHAPGDLALPREVEAGRQRLFDARARRVRPGLDDKALTEWNALMLSALVEAAVALGRADWLEVAVDNGRFLLAELRRADGRWLRSWQAEGGARHLAYAADHAALVDAFVRLAEATGQASWLAEARQAADRLLELFWDPAAGGLYTSGEDGERLITRTKDLMDNATPSANSMAAVALARLGALSGEDRYREAAESIVRLVGRLAVQHPSAFAHLLVAVDLLTEPPVEVVVAGERPDLLGVVQGRWLPRAVVAWGERYPSPLWEGREDGRAYVCRAYTCQLPATDPETLAAQLAAAETRGPVPVADLVAVRLPPGPAFVERLRRAWDAGDAVLPVDARLPDPAVERLLAALAPARLVEPSGAEVALAGGGRPVEPGDAVVVATSGTTGEPKGVVLTHDALAASARATSTRLAVDPARHHWLCCLPVAHVGGLSVVTRALWAGTPLTVLPSFSPAGLAAAAREGATHVSLVVTALAQIDASAFERIVLGGSAMPPTLPANVTVTYGMTETGSGCVYDGVPLDGVQVRTVDGELQLRAPLLLRAYRRRHGDEDPRLPGGWFPTGDLGEWDPHTGRVAVHGRRGDLIISGGQNVWPAPVERVLSSAAGVAAVAVVGRPDPHWGRAVTAVVVPRDPSSPPTLDSLRAAVKAELAPYCAPLRLELVESLPTTALGKVQRARL